MADVRLSAHGYGKSGVRLAKVVRDGDVHRFHDLTIDLSLAGDFSAAYIAGDNSTSLPTDTMRSTAYVVAQDVSLEEVETYAEAVLRKLLASTPAATSARADVVEHRWERLVVDGAEHPHAFRAAPAVGTATVVVERDGHVEVTSGLDGLVLAKTTGSGYEGFIKDDLTVLAETDDRIMATSVSASWTWSAPPPSYAGARIDVQSAFERVFATQHSLAVQQTLHAMAGAAIEEVPGISSVSLTLPNRHHVPVDLSPFGRTNDSSSEQQVFVVLDRPFGLISGTVTRS